MARFYLFLEGLIYGGKFAFQNRLGQPYSWEEIYSFCFVLPCISSESNFLVQAPRGAYIWRGNLTDGFLRYEFWGLYMEGLIFRILQYRQAKKRVFSKQVFN